MSSVKYPVVKLSTPAKEALLKAFATVDSVLTYASDRHHHGTEGGFMTNSPVQLLGNRSVAKVWAEAKVGNRIVTVDLTDWQPARSTFSTFEGEAYSDDGNYAKAIRRAYRTGEIPYIAREAVALIAYFVTQIQTGYPRSSESALKAKAGIEFLEAAGGTIEFRTIAYQKDSDAQMEAYWAKKEKGLPARMPDCIRRDIQPQEILSTFEACRPQMRFIEALDVKKTKGQKTRTIAL